jgi:hypothetical protein
VRTDVRVSLDPAGDSETRLRYDADAVVGGMVAGVGQRMLSAVGKRMAGEFFAAVDDVLTGKAALPAPATEGEAAQEVFTAPRGRGRGSEPGYARGVLVGAAVALAGVVVGAAISRLGRPR